jgi:hypothetical protein
MFLTKVTNYTKSLLFNRTNTEFTRIFCANSKRLFHFTIDGKQNINSNKESVNKVCIH